MSDAEVANDFEGLETWGTEISCVSLYGANTYAIHNATLIHALHTALTLEGRKVSQLAVVMQAGCRYRSGTLPWISPIDRLPHDACPWIDERFESCNPESAVGIRNRL